MPAITTIQQSNRAWTCHIRATESEVNAFCSIELRRLTLIEFHSRLSDEIDELKNLAVRDTDEDLFELKETCQRLQADLKESRTERDVLQQDIDQKQSLIQRHGFDMQNQIETIARLNNEVSVELDSRRRVCPRETYVDSFRFFNRNKNSRKTERPLLVCNRTICHWNVWRNSRRPFVIFNQK